MAQTWREEIEKCFGKDVYITGYSGESISSGSFVIDHLTGIGGFPLGNIVEIFGAEGCGKTTLALTVLKGALEAKRPFLYLDYEQTVSDVYLHKLGIDPKKIKDYRLTPETIEDGWTVIRHFCERKENEGGVVVVDSLAAMMPKFDEEKSEKEMGQTKVGSVASVMAVAIRSNIQALRAAKVCLIFTNQERNKIDTYARGGGGKTTPGGLATKFYAAMRLQLDVRASVVDTKDNALVDAKESKVVRAIKVGVKLIKNKFAPSYREGNIYIIMDKGIDDYSSAIEIGKKLGLVTESAKGGYFEIDQKYSGDSLGKKKVQGFTRLRQYLVDNPEVWGIYLADIKLLLKSDNKSEGETKNDDE